MDQDSRKPNECIRQFVALPDLFRPTCLRDLYWTHKCSLGEELKLVPEPTNPYDPNAIKVCRTNGEQLGYLPAEQAARFTHDIEIGWTYRATVDEIWHENRIAGCKLRIGVITMSSRPRQNQRSSTKRSEKHS